MSFALKLARWFRSSVSSLENRDHAGDILESIDDVTELPEAEEVAFDVNFQSFPPINRFALISRRRNFFE